MPAQILVLATLLSTVIPMLVGVGAFFVTLHWWTDRVLRSEPGVLERLQLEMSGARIAWAISGDYAAFAHVRPAPLVYAALVALAATVAEAAVFAAGSGVPFLWYLSGTIAAVIVSFVPFIAARLAKTPLCRLIDRTLELRANDKFAFAAQTISEISEIVRQIDEAYAATGLRARTDVLGLCRQAVLAHASSGHDAAKAELIGIKIGSEHDLRSVRHLAALLANARTALKQAKLGRGRIGVRQGAIEQIENLICSRDLADALEEGRWPQAHDLLNKIGFDLARLLDASTSDCETSQSVEDAYRTLNVSDETPLESIKAVVNAYRRVWHPDLARDEAECRQFTLRMQQIHVAWDIIQKARE
jgi:hypothetical protein